MTQECVAQLCTENSKLGGEWKWQAAGMCYIIRTGGNRLIIVDGGFNEDIPHIISKSVEMTGESVPRVALWIITHPHPDHYEALLKISENAELKSKLNIEAICCSQYEKTVFPRTGLSFEFDENNMRKITENLGVPVVVPHAGDIYDYDGLAIRILFTAEKHFEKLGDTNELSIIFQVVGKNKTLMITGDSYKYGADILAAEYWDGLKSDYCQIAHHGVNGSSTAFYYCVNPQYCLIPTSLACDSDVSTWEWGRVPRQFAERLAEKVFKACDGDCILPL